MSVETIDDSIDGPGGIRQSPRWAFDHLAEEWAARTWFGKLFFPAYLVDRTLMALVMLTLLSPFALVEFLRWLSWRTGRAWGRFRGHFPDTYKTNNSEAGHK